MVLNLIHIHESERIKLFCFFFSFARHFRRPDVGLRPRSWKTLGYFVASHLKPDFCHHVITLVMSFEYSKPTALVLLLVKVSVKNEKKKKLSYYTLHYYKWAVSLLDFNWRIRQTQRGQTSCLPDKHSVITVAVSNESTHNTRTLRRKQLKSIHPPPSLLWTAFNCFWWSI